MMMWKVSQCHCCTPSYFYPLTQKVRVLCFQRSKYWVLSRLKCQAVETCCTSLGTLSRWRWLWGLPCLLGFHVSLMQRDSFAQVGSACFYIDLCIRTFPAMGTIMPSKKQSFINLPQHWGTVVCLACNMQSHFGNDNIWYWFSPVVYLLPRAVNHIIP